MSNSFWIDPLSPVLNLKNPANKPAAMRLALIGVGNEMQADDAAGLLVVRSLKKRLADSPDVLIIEGGLAPENFTGKIRNFKPERVIFIDAAEMGLAPGEFDWVALEQVDGFSASSHIMPLSVLAKFIKQDIGCDVKVLGIQVKRVEFGEEMTPEVRGAVNKVGKFLIKKIQAQ